ncbi:MAG: hypothetical protein R3Y43_05670 [Alphaproteobacteria bacterium]
MMKILFWCFGLLAVALVVYSVWKKNKEMEVEEKRCFDYEVERLKENLKKISYLGLQSSYRDYFNAQEALKKSSSFEGIVVEIDLRKYNRSAEAFLDGVSATR